MVTFTNNFTDKWIREILIWRDRWIDRERDTEIKRKGENQWHEQGLAKETIYRKTDKMKFRNQIIKHFQWLQVSKLTDRQIDRQTGKHQNINPKNN